MAYTISDDCIMCGACADNCPCDAISEGDGKYEINADACVDCGSCAEGLFYIVVKIKTVKIQNPTSAYLSHLLYHFIFAISTIILRLRYW
jgi:ferredoxin